MIASPWTLRVGMVFSNVIAFFIIVTTAAVLNAGGVTNIRSAAEAAGALRPLAGDLTFVMFALGIVGAGLLAVPVLAGSAAYCVAEAFGWPVTLEARARTPSGFTASLRPPPWWDWRWGIRRSTLSKC